MIATSTVVMFVLMYLNTYLLGHLFFSETRAYMAVLMGAAMAFVMMAFMWGMYSKRAVNFAILCVAVIGAGGALWLVRSQATVGDLSYMRAMIPHHSIAIMTSNRANLEDDRVNELADAISYAQNKEIAEMRYLIDDITADGKQADAGEGLDADVMSLDNALASPMVGALDAQPLTANDLTTGLPDVVACRFTFTTESPAVLAVGEAGGEPAALLKISDDLVRLAQTAAGEFETDGARVQVTAPEGDANLDAAPDGRMPADMVLTLDAGLTAGYRGFYACDG